MNPIILGSAALESILCRPSALGSINTLFQYIDDAWTVEFPGLVSLPRFNEEPRRLRVCIATEDIVGPVRNGGIGTTYAALAELLVSLDIDTTILYLRGRHVENGTIEHWIEHYAAKGVRFVPVPNYAGGDRFQTGSDRWLHAPYNMLRYLLENPMDVVHVSEWRGSAYLCLMAKRQGLAFDKSLFVVKTSSPWMWNRLYGLQPLDRIDDLAKVHAERQSVELADMVIGGSLHLLRWMASQGYRVQRQRTFVQPNVVTFEHLKELLDKRKLQPGTRMKVDEIVFFGRLEARKGLFVFCQAIKRLLRQGVSLPPKITFMGKPGARLAARPDQDIVDYITSESVSWPTEIQILTEFQQYDALQYLLGGERLAVMPSIIENSSLAVYEAAICGIPFIASSSGGTPELVAREDHEHVLCEAHPIPVAQKIAEALELGGYVARPSFDNDVNLDEWRQFHKDLGSGLIETLLRTDARPVSPANGISVCIYHPASDDALRATLVSIKQQEHQPADVLIAVDTDDPASLDRANTMAREIGLEVKVTAAYDLDAGPAFNLVADDAAGDFILFLWSGATLQQPALRALARVATSSQADVINYFYRVTHGDDETRNYLNATIFGSVSQAFFRTEMTALPLCVRKTTFLDLNGFTTDYRVLGHDYEFVAKAQVSDCRCETALMELGTVPAWDEAWLTSRCYDQSVAQFRAIRPKLAATPLALRDLLLMAKGLQARPPRRGRERPAKVAQSADEKEGPVARMLNALSMDILSSDAQPLRKEPRRAARAVNGGAPPKPAAAPKRRSGVIDLIEQLSADGAQSDDMDFGTQPSRRAAKSRATRAAARQSNEPHHILGSSRYAGELLAVHDGHVQGWVKNHENPGEAVQVEVLDARGSVICEVPATATLATAQPLGSDYRRHGFIAPLRRSKITILGRNTSSRFTVRVKNSDVEIGSLDLYGSSDLEAAGYDGYCDLIDHTIRGWVWRPSAPERASDVTVFVDGRLLAKARAEYFREDLRRAGIGGGNYGFEVPIPKVFRDGTPREIVVALTHSGLLLKRGRLRLVGNTITEVAKPRKLWWTNRSRPAP